MNTYLIDKFLVNFYDEKNEKINEQSIEFNYYPSHEKLEIEMEYYRTNYPFKETKWFNVEKKTFVKWLE